MTKTYVQKTRPVFIIVVSVALLAILLVLIAGEECGAERIDCLVKGHFYPSGDDRGDNDTKYRVFDVLIDGDYAYVINSTHRVGGRTSHYLSILNISDRTSPVLAGYCDATSNYPEDLVVNDNYAYIADYSGLVIIDISDKNNPERVGRDNTTGYATDVAVEGDYAYLLDTGDALGLDGEGLIIYDITDKTKPERIGRENTTRYGPGSLAVSEDYVYVNNNRGEIAIIDCHDKTEPQISGDFSTGGSANDIFVKDNTAYIIHGHDLFITDISDRTSPQVLGSCSKRIISFHEPDSVVVSGNYAYLNGPFGGVVIMNIEDKTMPRVAGHYGAASYVRGAAVAGDYAYVSVITPWDDGGDGWISIVELARMLSISTNLATDPETNPVYDSETVVFNGNEIDMGPNTRYLWHSSIDGEIYNGTDTEFESSNLSVGLHTIYLKVMDDDSNWSSEISTVLEVVDSSYDADDDTVTNQDEERIFNSDPFHSNLLGNSICDISYSPSEPVMIDELQIEVSITAPHTAHSYYLHYKTLISNWKKVEITDVEESPLMNLNKWLPQDYRASTDATFGRTINLSYKFDSYEFSTGEEIQFYITDNKQFNYNDLEMKQNDDSANVKNLETITIESEANISYTISLETIITVVGSIFLAAMLLRRRFYKRFESVMYGVCFIMKH